MTEEEEVWRERVYEGILDKATRILGKEPFTKGEQLRQWVNSLPAPPSDVFGGQIWKYTYIPGTIAADLKVEYMWLKEGHELHTFDLGIDVDDW